jgi:hypothetical protein
LSEAALIQGRRSLIWDAEAGGVRGRIITASEDRDVDRPLTCTALFLTSGQFVRMRRHSIILAIILVGAVMLIRATIPIPRVPVFCPIVVWCLAAFVWQRRARQAAVSVASTMLMVNIPTIAFGAAHDAGALPLFGVNGKWQSKHKCDRRHGGDEAVAHRSISFSWFTSRDKKHQRQMRNGEGTQRFLRRYRHLRCIAIFPSRNDHLQDNRP